jgi:hypothetical protein
MKRELEIKKEGGVLVGRGLMDLYDTVHMWVQTIGNGDWVLRLEKKVRQRGLSQNALLWVWMDVLSKEWAEATDQHYTKEQWKEFFAREFLPVTGPGGVTIGGSTSELTVEQMTKFLTKIQVYAAEQFGITLLGAEDRMFNEWRNQYE